MSIALREDKVNDSVNNLFESCQLGGVRWRVREGYRFLLSLMPFGSPESGKIWRLVKEYPIKKVLQATIDDMRRFGPARACDGRTEAGYILKIYRPVSRWSRLASLVRSSKAEKEFEVSMEVHRRGIPTVLPIAVGVRRRRGVLEESYVVFPRVSGCLGLDEFLKGAVPVDTRVAALELRRRVIHAYGNFARAVHDTGIYQDDFDPNNILLSLHEGAIDLRIVDFERARVGKTLSLQKRIWLLAKLDRFRAATRTDRIRFIRGYCSKLPQSSVHEHTELVRLIVKEAERVLGRDLRRAAENCCEENRNTGVFESGKVRGFYRKRFPGRQAMWTAGRDEAVSLAEAAASGMGILPMSKDHGLEARVTGGEAVKAEMDVRTFTGPDGPERARALWQVANALLRVGIPVQLPLFLAVRDSKGLKSKMPRVADEVQVSALVAFKSAPSVSQPATAAERMSFDAESMRLLARAAKAFGVWTRGRPSQWQSFKEPVSHTRFVWLEPEISGEQRDSTGEDPNRKKRLALRGTTLPLEVSGFKFQVSG